MAFGWHGLHIVSHGTTCQTRFRICGHRTPARGWMLGVNCS